MNNLFFTYNTKTEESNLVDLQEIVRVKLYKEKATFFMKNGTQFDADDTYFYVLSHPEAFESQEDEEIVSPKIVEV